MSLPIRTMMHSAAHLLTPMGRTSRRAMTGLAVAGLLAMALAPSPRTPTANAASNNKLSQSPFCQRVVSPSNPKGSIEVSAGAQMACFGPQRNGAVQPFASTPGACPIKFGSNVDAACPAEDVTPSGVQISGQSEESIASAGNYVVEAWNDGTGFFAPCGSPMNKEELTGFGFSTDGGKTFTDLGGLPNANCATSLTEGDPSVEAYTVGGSTYFYISSIFIPFFVPENALSVTACKVTGSGSTATLSCGQPIVAAISSDCVTVPFTFCSFLDKEFLSIDPVRGRLYMSYTEFGVTQGFGGVIELAVCDLSNPASPTCHNGGDGSITGAGAPAAPYFVVAPGDPNFCENEGAYPAVDPNTGNVYVAYEHDWFSGLFNCGGETTQNVMNYIPFSCLTLSAASPCAGPAATQAVNITSMEAQFIPGYNRFPMNDFPRIAVSDAAGTVSMVWNDARFHAPTGDILLQSFNLGSLSLVQSQPVQVNKDASYSWKFLPAVRTATAAGNLDVSYYSRAGLSGQNTNYVSDLNVNPRSTNGASHDVVVTTAPSDWSTVSSIIVPNFGDYTDNYTVGKTIYYAWADGRIGAPQPFEDHSGS